MLARSTGFRRTRTSSHLLKTRSHDVVTISNLCVDVIVRVDKLPEVNPDTLKRLASEVTSKANWEVGGNANFLIAGSRLGLKGCAIGCVGGDPHGVFLKDVLRQEGVGFRNVAVDTSNDANDDGESFRGQTLVCYVMIDSMGNHAFCSAYDFGPWPLLGGRRDVPTRIREALDDSGAMYLNGFAFDELDAELIGDIMLDANANDVDVFFDIGPRAFGLEKRPNIWKDNLLGAMGHADVVLLTLEEAQAFTLERSPSKAAKFLLHGQQTEWVILKDGPNGATLYQADGKAMHQNAFQVDVVDTVGCGDSFASAIVMGYTGKHDVPATLKLANAVGAATATRQGAGRNVASIEKVKKILQTNTKDADVHQRQLALKAIEIFESKSISSDHADMSNN